MKKTGLFHILTVVFIGSLFGQASPELTVEKIMQDPKWIGSSPSRVNFSPDGQSIYFNWNPDGAEISSLYRISAAGGTPRKVSDEDRRALPSFFGDYNKDRSEYLYTSNGDIFNLNLASGKITAITNTLGRESSPAFTTDEKGVIYSYDNNLFKWNGEDGTTIQITNFKSAGGGRGGGGGRGSGGGAKSDAEKWVAEEEQSLIGILRERGENREAREARNKADRPWRPKEIDIASDRLMFANVSPDEKFIVFGLSKSARSTRRTIVPNYITESAYTEDINARTKVGTPQSTYRMGIYDVAGDTVKWANPEKLKGINDVVELMGGKAAESKGNSRRGRNSAGTGQARSLIYSSPKWSPDGSKVLVTATATDHKDRWITLLNLKTGELQELDHQHDDAWIGGPGISRFSSSTTGWLPDGKSVWFQSEASGYSHIYTKSTGRAKKKALTKGKFEIYSPFISLDKKSWYFVANRDHPGVREVYSMALKGGRMTKITDMKGGMQSTFSPNDGRLAFLHSTGNRPWELYIQENKAGSTATKITKSTKAEWDAYSWRLPEYITFKARDGVTLHARLYRPEEGKSNGAGVVFVHGAGYLQNAHKWWSSYYREYMFNNLLTDRGYTVIDIDYRASSGYGRDWRTAIYRFMGGHDLNDNMDGAKLLASKYGVDAGRIGLYGGSYGGFIAFMAMFTAPGDIASAAALRPVSDWAHYNHGYTSNILNIPQADSVAYRRSSPIYHAEGLEGNLLILHGMVDTNVHFQDVVRLTQRLIELGKDNWELAVYPMEGHGFREPSSWTDEYKRILKLFETTLR